VLGAGSNIVRPAPEAAGMDQGRRDIRHTHTRDDDAKPGLPAGSATETQRHRDNTSAATRTVTSAKLVNGANKKNTSKKGRRGSVDRDAPKRETSFERAPGHMSSRGASQPSVRLDGADDIGVENRDVERPGVLDLGRSKRQRSELRRRSTTHVLHITRAPRPRFKLVGKKKFSSNHRRKV